jgi:hydrophobic/amphiphilic exporter-1 (mainly G- bacteria), HAE1 family
MIRFFAGHPTAANLVMLLLLVLGIAALPTIVRSTFPQLPLRHVEIQVEFPGAAAERVEDAICRRLEDALDRIDQIREMRCEARENLATTRIEAIEGASVDRLLADVRGEISAIDDFPDLAEEPRVRLLGTTEPVVSIAAYGDLPRPELKDYAESLKQRLLRIDGVSRVQIEGFTERQLRVDLDERALRSLGLSVADVAARIRAQSLDLPAGDLETDQGYVFVRVDEERTTPATLESLVIAGSTDGGVVRLRDVARIVDTFQFPNQHVLFDARPAALLGIEKARRDDALDILASIEAFIAEEQSRTPAIRLALTRDIASLVEDRLMMLVRNGAQGLLLVMLVLWLFFSARHAFWVAMGLPVSFAGAFALMSVFGYQFDMMTLVALLVAIGILVDDAIVVSENIAVHRARGKDPVTASVDGAREVMPGIFASFITTACIFAPLAFLSGDLGAVLKVVPIVLLMTLSVSFVEAFLILPAHLRHTRLETKRHQLQHWTDERLGRFREFVVGTCVSRFVRYRYVGLGSLLGVLLLAVAAVAGGLMRFNPLPELDNESIEARLLLPPGTPFERTVASVDTVLDALRTIDRELTPRQPGGQPLVRHVTVQYGRNVDAYETGDHVATITVDLLSPEIRSHTSTHIRNLWRERAGQLPDAIALRFADPMIGPQGKPIELRVAGNDRQRLHDAAHEILRELSRFRGVQDLSTDLRPGKPEILVRLRPGAESLGITAAVVAEQLRGALFGLRAGELQIGPERFEVQVRLDERARSSLDTLDGFMVRTAHGLVPLSAIAELEESLGWARLNRVDRRPVVTIEGLVDQSVTTSAAVLGTLERRFLPEWRQRYPDVELSAAGESEQAEITFASLRRGFALGFVGIYLLLAFQFRSYLEPLVVVSIIPLAFIGVVLGHLLLGYNLAMPSMLGFVSLAGIAVNNSILLVTFVEHRLAAGMALAEAVVQASRDRFRAILLTSLTTVAGLLPLLLETSMQAKVVIPLAISLAFGLSTATVLVLFVIPALYMVLEDFGLFRRHAELRGGDPAPA